MLQESQHDISTNVMLKKQIVLKECHAEFSKHFNTIKQMPTAVE
jgi:hypothetical protein